LIEIIQIIIKKTNPEKIQIFSDLSDYILTNSHLIYFKNFQVLKSNLIMFINILKHGEKNYELPSLNSLKPDEEEMFFHKWRDKASIGILKSKLLDIANKKNFGISNAKIMQVLKSGKYDYFDNGESTMLLDYPYFMNAFIDQFICDILL
jgi:hypothetical protein